MPTLPLEDLVWAAGLFEGEGTVRIGRPKPGRRSLGHLEVSVPNTDIEVVEFFDQRWSGYCKLISGTTIGNRRVAFRWCLSARKAATFLEDIQPHVRTERVAAKIRLALSYQDQKRSPGSLALPGYTERQWELYERMALLNKRGAA